MNDEAEWKFSKWFGHMERMSGERLTKRPYESKVEGKGTEAGIARFDWKEQKGCRVRALELRDAKVKCIGREQ